MFAIELLEHTVHPSRQPPVKSRAEKLMRKAAYLISLLALVHIAAAQELQMASLGDFKLVSGEVIRDCRIGYRTFGRLNAEKSNVVVFATWFRGTTKDLVDSIGPGKLVDSSKYYVIAIDALGDGVSSSPSNSPSQLHMNFPQLTIRDMVNSQHQLLTSVLHLVHLKAVMGISMGGMQSFQWMVAYPGFMDRDIPIVGSPRLAGYDINLWTAENDAIMRDPAWNKGDYTDNPEAEATAEIDALAIITPQRYNRQNSREQTYAKLAKETHDPSAFDANNHIRQSQAMMSLDVSDAFSGSMEGAAAAVKAKVLVIVNDTDHMVTPGPALAFAKLLHAEVLELNNECGHLLLDCEFQRVADRVAAFLAE
jgi:homoserine O-acetyltransferase